MCRKQTMLTMLTMLTIVPMLTMLTMLTVLTVLIMLTMLTMLTMQNSPRIYEADRIGAVPKGSALFINQGGYEAGYIRHLSISNLTGDAPNHTYEHG